MTIRPEFEFHQLNEDGKTKAVAIASCFSMLLDQIETLVPPGRELALVKTHLQDASTWAKRAIAQLKENQVEQAK